MQALGKQGKIPCIHESVCEHRCPLLCDAYAPDINVDIIRSIAWDMLSVKPLWDSNGKADIELWQVLRWGERILESIGEYRWPNT